MSDSTILTIGTALHHAWDSRREVQVLVDGGGWVTGTVAGVDGHGVVFKETSQPTHLVMRLEAVLAVRIEPPASKVPQQPDHGREAQQDGREAQPDKGRAVALAER